jgi:CRP-like cAMP-binding protein
MEPASEAREFLGDIPLFAEALDAAQIRFLAEHSRFVLFRAGTLLMAQGDFGTSMYVIVDGTVSVAFADEEGRERVVATLGPKDVVGEMSLFTGDRRTANVGAATNVHALEITKASLERMFSMSPGLLDRFGAILAARQAELASLTPARSHPAHQDLIRRARSFFRDLFGRGVRV